METNEVRKDNSEARSSKKIIFGTFLGYVSLLLNIISGFVFVPWISNSLGKSVYGLYTLSGSLISMLLIDIGLSTTANAFMSKYKAEGREDKIQNLLALIDKTYFVIDLILFTIFLTLYFFLGNIYRGLTESEMPTFRVLYIITALYSLISFPATSLDGVLSSYEEFAYMKGLEILQKILYVAFTSLAIFLNWGIYLLVLINAGSGIICIGGKLLIVRFKLKIKPNFHYRPDKKEIASLLSFSLWNAVISICWRLAQFASPSILGIVSDSTNIAIYGVASSIEYYAFSICGVVTGFFLPKISRIFEDSDQNTASNKLLQLAIKIAKIISFLLLLVIVGFASCGQEFIALWMRDVNTYGVAYYGILIMIVSESIVFPNTVLRNALYFENRIRYLAICQIASSVVFVCLAFLFGYWWGAIGVCSAIGVSQLVLAVGTNICYHSKLKISLKQYYSSIYLKQIPATLFSLVIGLTLHFFLPFSLGWKISLEFVGVIFSYVPLNFFLSFSKNERLGVRQLLLGRFRKRK